MIDDEDMNDGAGRGRVTALHCSASLRDWHDGEAYVKVTLSGCLSKVVNGSKLYLSIAI